MIRFSSDLRFAYLRVGLVSLIILSLVLGLVPLDMLTKSSAFNLPEAKAQDSKAPVEVIEKRTDNSKTFLNSDGSFTARLSQSPIHFSQDGKWLDIDANIKQADDGSFENTAGFFKARFGAKGKSPALSAVEYEDFKVEFSLAEAQTADVAPKVDGREITYENILPDTDIRVVITGVGTKEDIILKKYTGKNSFTFEMKTTGVDPVKEPGGSVSFYKKGTQEKVFSIPKPFMVDSNIDKDSDEGPRSEDVFLDIHQKGSSTFITITADDKWLKAPERVYPVYVDPTLWINAASHYADDAYVTSKYPDNNYDADWNSTYKYYQLKCGYYDSTTGTNYPYIKFSVSALSGKLINRALLHVYCKHSYLHSTPKDLWLDYVKWDWDPAKITWNNKPESYLKWWSQIAEGQWTNLDVTDRVADRVMNRITGDYGFKFHENGNGKEYWKKFVAAETGVEIPALEVDYSDPPSLSGSAYGNGVNSTNGYVNLSWNSVSGATGYKVWIYNGKAYEAFDVGNVTSWSTKDKKIWPTASEIASGRYALHHDGKGVELADNPSPVYKNSGGSYPNNQNYWFRVTAYNSVSETSLGANCYTPTLPDRTAPPGVSKSSVVLSHARNADGTVNVKVDWTGLNDYVTGANYGTSYYKVELEKFDQATGASLGKLANPVNAIHTGTSTHTYTFCNVPGEVEYKAHITTYDKNGNFPYVTGSLSTPSPTVSDLYDTAAPATTYILSGNSGQNGWYTSDVTVTLSAFDGTGGSGVSKTEYSFDGENWVTYAPFSVTGEGITTVYYRSVDGKGNSEVSNRASTALFDEDFATFNSDQWLDATYLPYFVGRPQTINQTTIDAKSVIYMQTAETPSSKRRGISYSTSFMATPEMTIEMAIKPIGDLDGTIELWLYDRSTSKFIRTALFAGNYGANRLVCCDVSGYSTRSSTYPIHNWGDWLFFKVSSVDNKTTVYLLDANKNVKWSTSYDIPITNVLGDFNVALSQVLGGPSSGTYYMKAYVDSINVSRIDASYKKVDVKIDRIDPTTGCTLNGTQATDGWYTSETTVTLAADDGQGGSGASKTEYSFDNTNWNTYTAPFVVSDEGITTVYYRSEDLAGNVEVSTSTAIKIDQANPVAYATPAGGIYNLAQSVSLTASEPASIYYTLDETTPTASSTKYLGLPVDILFSSTLKFIAIDQRGNSSPVYTETYTIDTVAPTSSISSPADGATVTGDTTITVSSTDDISLSEVKLSIQKLGTNVLDLETETATGTSISKDWKLDTAKLGDGEYILTLTATDTAGNSSPTQINIKVDNIQAKMGLGHWGTIDCDYGKVNIANGNFITSQEDLSLPGRGLGTNLTRVYNSQVKANGPLGLGWRLNLPVLSEYSDGSVLITDASGAEQYYTANQDGTYNRPVGNYDILSKNTDGTFSLKFKDGSKYKFDQANRKVTLQDSNNNTTTYQLDTNNRVSSITDPSGRVTSLSYDQATGKLISVTDYANRTFSYTYDANDNLTKVTGPENYSIAFAYDSAHKLISVTDANDNTTSYTYTDDKLTKVTDPMGNTTGYSYDSAAKQFIKTDPRGYATKYVYDGNWNVTSTTDALNNTSTLAFDSNYNLISKTDGLNRTTTYTYDSMGNKLSVTYPQVEDPNNPGSFISYKEQYQYDENNNVTAYTDANGSVTNYTYDTKSNLVQIKHPAVPSTEGTSTVSYTESFEYDSYGNKIAATDNNGNRTTYEYDSNGNMTKITYPPVPDPANPSVYIQYTEVYAYDALGNKLSETDPNSNTTDYTYDLLGRMTKVTHPEVPDPSNPAQNIRYTESFVYDNNGNKIAVTDQNGNIINYAYDSMDRVTSTIFPAVPDSTGNKNNPVSYTVTYAYDEVGNRIAETNENTATTTYKYDALGRLTEVLAPPVYNDTDTPTQYKTIYAYDKVGNKAFEIDHNGNKISYTYDDLDRVVAKGI